MLTNVTLISLAINGDYRTIFTMSDITPFICLTHWNPVNRPEIHSVNESTNNYNHIIYNFVIGSLQEALEQYALAAAGETLRLLGPASEGAASIGISLTEWEDYRMDMVSRYGIWCDTETIAVRNCERTEI